MKIYQILAYSESARLVIFNHYHICPEGTADTAENAVKHAMELHPGVAQSPYPDVQFLVSEFDPGAGILQVGEFNGRPIWTLCQEPPELESIEPGSLGLKPDPEEPESEPSSTDPELPYDLTSDNVTVGPFPVPESAEIEPEIPDVPKEEPDEPEQPRRRGRRRKRQ